MGTMKPGMASANVVKGVLAAVLALSGCEKNEKKEGATMGKSRVTEIVTKLRSDDAGVRQEAAAKLDTLAAEGLTIEEADQALRAAAESWPTYDDLDPSYELLQAALSRKDSDYLALLSDHFPGFSKWARGLAVDYLVDTGNDAAAQTYWGLIQRHRDLVPGVSIEGFTQSPEATRRLLPELLRYGGADDLGYQIQLFALRAAQLGLLTPAELAPFTECLVGVYRPMRERMREMESPADDDWMWSDEYYGDRAHATLLLDLMGYLPGEAVVADLGEALTSRDPRVRLFAALGLIRHGREVRPEVIEGIAAAPEVRNWLFDGLVSLDRRNLFPARFAAQEALAESDMVGWLIFPTELGRPPHEIELMATFDDDEGEQRYYLFRFRTHAPHWAAKDGWETGLAGPFEIAAMPTTEAGGHTFSMFDKWEEKTPKEHFEAISGLMAKHWKDKAAKADPQKEE